MIDVLNAKRLLMVDSWSKFRASTEPSIHIESLPQAVSDYIP